MCGMLLLLLHVNTFRRTKRRAVARGKRSEAVSEAAASALAPLPQALSNVISRVCALLNHIALQRTRLVSDNHYTITTFVMVASWSAMSCHALLSVQKWTSTRAAVTPTQRTQRRPSGGSYAAAICSTAAAAVQTQENQRHLLPHPPVAASATMVATNHRAQTDQAVEVNERVIVSLHCALLYVVSEMDSVCWRRAAPFSVHVVVREGHREGGPPTI